MTISGRNVDTFSTHLGPPDWNPKKQSLGNIFDKFGAGGGGGIFFECCNKGPEGSQPQTFYQEGEKKKIREEALLGAKGAAKGSCGETLVQRGVFGEPVSSLPPSGFS